MLTNFMSSVRLTVNSRPCAVNFGGRIKKLYVIFNCAELRGGCQLPLKGPTRFKGQLYIKRWSTIREMQSKPTFLLIMLANSLKTVLMRSSNTLLVGIENKTISKDCSLTMYQNDKCLHPLTSYRREQWHVQAAS